MRTVPAACRWCGRILPIPVKPSDVEWTRDGVYRLTSALKEPHTDLADDGSYSPRLLSADKEHYVKLAWPGTPLRPSRCFCPVSVP